MGRKGEARGSGRERDEEADMEALEGAAAVTVQRKFCQNSF